MLAHSFLAREVESQVVHLLLRPAGDFRGERGGRLYRDFGEQRAQELLGVGALVRIDGPSRVRVLLKLLGGAVPASIDRRDLMPTRAA